MAIDHILEMLDRAHQGPVHTAKEWNIRILPTAVSQKLDEHRLRQTFDRENPINADDALADEFFKAGFELAVNLGLFCRDTERAIKVTEDELSYALKKAPSELALGEGMDRVVIKSRTPEDKYQPLLASSLSVVISEDIWVRLMQGIVQNREVDIFQGGSLTTIFGRPVLAGTPYETLLGRYVAQMAKEALWRAGRPGMCTNQVISATTEYGQFGGFGIKGGFDPATSIAVALGPGELATSYSTLHKVVHSVNCGSMLSMGCPSLIGGSSGSPEGAALTQIAGTLLQFAVHEAHFSGGSTTDIRYGGTTGREALWSTSVAKQAVSRNTRVLGKGIMSQRGGPCTEMLLYECAVAMMDVSASGVSYVSTPRSAGGQYTDYLTPLECKFCGEVVKRSAGMTRKKVNEIAKVLIPKYEDKLLDPPKGQSFRECYDLKTLTPTQEWLDIYLKVKKELIEFGVPLD